MGHPLQRRKVGGKGEAEAEVGERHPHYQREEAERDARFRVAAQHELKLEHVRGGDDREKGKNEPGIGQILPELARKARCAYRRCQRQQGKGDEVHAQQKIG